MISKKIVWVSRSWPCVLILLFAGFSMRSQQNTIDSLTSILSSSTSSSKIKAASALSLGEVYFMKNNLAEALELFNQALLAGEKLKDKKICADALNNMAIVYNRNGNLTKCIELLEQSLKLKKEVNDIAGIGKACNNLGYFYQAKGDDEKAFTYYLSGEKLQKQSGDTSGRAYTLVNIGKIYLKRGDQNKAKEYFDESLKLRELIEDKKGISESTAILGLLAFDNKDNKTALQYARRSLNLANELKMPVYIKNASELLYKIYRSQNDVKHALEMHELYTVTKDTLTSEKMRKASIQKGLQIAYERKALADSVKASEAKRVEQLKHEQEISRQRSYTYGGIIALILMLVVTLISFKAYKQKQKDNHLISAQKQLVDIKQKEIIDSINYAKKIQNALLANEGLINQHIPEHFVFFKPKDIVSGDFYWTTSVIRKQSAVSSSLPTADCELFYLAVCDSTGHGVPGAFMSLLNISFLNESVKEKNLILPGEILNHVRQQLIDVISKEGGQDGMDAILLCINKTERTITYSAANNTPLLVEKGIIKELEKDKMPVGKGPRSDSFTSYSIPYNEGNVIYLCTDGFADQFGGGKGKKFKHKQLTNLLLSVSSLPLNEQRVKLEDVFQKWKGPLEQVDDVCIIGIKL
ncbi:MAG: tetratricopeptide repeat protein [Bacteroidetes bacterium]|nr:tetratricopeptide repeat protein [Bacteroidota bacterium]